MARVLNRCPLKGTPKLLLVGIANHDGDGGAWPSVDTLARYCSVDRRNVQRAITKLVETGWLEVVPQGGGHRDDRSDQRPNLYRIRWPDGAATAPPRDQSDGAATPRERGGDSARNGAAPAPPELSLNRPEPSNAPLGAADAAAGQLPGLDSQPVDQLVDAVDQSMNEARDSLAWKLVRETYEARSKKPIESRKTAARTVRRLLDAGWAHDQIRQALMSSPAWTPTSLQVELARGGRKPTGRVWASREERASGDGVWKPGKGRRS